MRVKIGLCIYSVIFASHRPGTNIINVNTSNGLYTVVFPSSKIADEAHDTLLKNGWIDVSDYDYSN